MSCVLFELTISGPRLVRLWMTVRTWVCVEVLVLGGVMSRMTMWTMLWMLLSELR